MPESLWFLDNLAQVHVDGAASGGGLGLVELAGRGGDMPPLHLHRSEDEVFYVLDGRMTVFVSGCEPVELGPGQSAFAPRGVPHVYRVESERARWLAAVSPSGFDEFVREISEPAECDDLPPEGRVHDVSRVGAAAARHGIEILGPPGVLPQG
jgi:mannose-6-phosphate isomerase-like protein (cupin superfamily)